MRQVLPVPIEGVDAAETYRSDPRPAPPGRPWVMINMISSIDGGTAVDGRSRGLASPADRQVFTALRAVADVILVGAGTVRAEGYGPPLTSEPDQHRRSIRGQSPFPRIAVVTAGLDLDMSSSLFTGSVQPPIILTTSSAEPARLERAHRVAEVHLVGGTSVDLVQAMAILANLGAGIVLCEGGPRLNGQLLGLGLLDELCLSISPLLAGGGSARIAEGGPAATPVAMTLDRILEEDGMLLLRYVRSTSGGGQVSAR